MYVATIIANATKRNLPVEELRKFGRVEVIKESVAADVFFETSDFRLQTSDCDVIIQEVKTRHKKLLVCDMESTIIENEFLDEMADLCGVGEKVASITARAMNGEISFPDALNERVKLVAGISEDAVRGLIKSRLKYSEGARELIAACRQAGVHTALVSGGFTLFTECVARDLGFDEHHANELIFENGRLAGIKKPILGKQSKLDFLEKKSAEMGISLELTAAIGDGANDLPMLHAAGLGIGYKAKKLVREQIKNQINYSDLMALSYAIGVNNGN